MESSILSCVNQPVNGFLYYKIHIKKRHSVRASLSRGKITKNPSFTAYFWEKFYAFRQVKVVLKFSLLLYLLFIEFSS